MYFKPEQILGSFLRLSPRTREGKTHLERTSALLYFLSFDATCKRFKTSELDFNPSTETGQTARKQIELEFEKLVVIDRSCNTKMQVIEFGRVATGAKDPTQRISSNFLTVPLKKASESTDPCSYPRRPKAPLMNLGRVSSEISWGIGYHQNWQSNIERYIVDIKESTALTDLAIFVSRDFKFSEGISSYVEALSMAIKDKYSSELSKLWIKRIQTESAMVRHIVSPFTSDYIPYAGLFYKINGDKTECELDSEAGKLHEHIKYLEALLKANKIVFNRLK